MRLLIAYLMAGLALCAVSAFALQDRSVLVPAPEVVVREFARQLTLHRYEQATKYLAYDARPRTGAGALRAFVRAIERNGRIHHVDGVRGPMSAGKARADAILKRTENEPVVTMRVLLAEENGLWRIVRIASPNRS
jgi:hypothetical protein